MDTLTDLLQDELRDIYNAEQQITKALPKMAKKATSEALKHAFTTHLQETQNQIRRLEQIGEEMDIKLTGKRCRAMEGLVEEGKEAMEEDGLPAVVDAALIGAAQRVELYEVAAYGTARAMAEALDQTKVARLLQETLDEERAADRQLTDIAMKEVLFAAVAADTGADSSAAAG